MGPDAPAPPAPDPTADLYELGIEIDNARVQGIWVDHDDAAPPADRANGPARMADSQIVSARATGRAAADELTAFKKMRESLHAKTQTLLAAMIVATVPLIVLLAWGSIWAGRPAGDIRDFTVALLGSVGGLSGA